jgi:PKD repeat protein
MMRKWMGLIIVLGLVLPATGILTGISQESSDPSWLIRNSFGDSIIQLSVWTSNGDFQADESYDQIVSFKVSSPAYVYLFNISPASNNRQVQLLLPNKSTTNNFFAAGTYSLNEEYTIVGPAGEAYVQAVASPIPLDISGSDIDTFRSLGNDPELYLDGLKLLIEAKGLTALEWTGDWTSYGVIASGVEPLAGSRCARILLQAPALQGKTVQYSIDANCINSRPMTGQFVGPNSPEISQVLEGDRTITISATGFDGQVIKQKVSFGSAQTIQFASLKPVEYFDVNINPVNPEIYQNVTFAADLRTTRQISSYLWDFGDGSAQQEGVSVPHLYQKPATSDAPYRVKLTIFFKDNQDPQSVVVSKSLEVGSEPIPGACPPNTVTDQTFARSILLESNQPSGCYSKDIPQSLIQQGSSVALQGHVQANVQYSWESVPNGADVQAYITPHYEGADGVTTGQEPKVALLPATSGIFTKQIDLNIPAGSVVKLVLVLNILSNPGPGTITLEVGPIDLTSAVSTCKAASLQTRNEAAASQGDLISFASGTEVKVVFQNKGCPDIDVSRDSLAILQNGSAIFKMNNAAATVSKGVEVVWSWNQKDSSGNPVQKGLYTIQIETSQGTYTTRAIIAK